MDINLMMDLEEKNTLAKITEEFGVSWK